MSIIRSWRLPSMLAICGLAAVAGVGCGGDDSTSTTATESGQGKMKVLNAVFPPAVSTAPLKVGIDKGFFADEGIELKVDKDLPAPQITPNLLSGRVQVAVTTAPTVVSLAANDVPLTISNQLTTGGATAEEDDSAALVMADSGIESVEDLAGKTVAVVTPGGIPEIALHNLADKAGMDPDEIKVTVLGFSDMGPALVAGKVDAIVTPEPFWSQLEETADVRVLFGLSEGVFPEMPFGVSIVSKKFAAAEPATLAALQSAIRRSVEYAAENQEEVRAAMPEWTGLPKPLTEKITLPPYNPDLDEADLQRLADMASSFGFIEDEVDMADYVVQD